MPLCTWEPCWAPSVDSPLASAGGSFLPQDMWGWAGGWWRRRPFAPAPVLLILSSLMQRRPQSREELKGKDQVHRHVGLGVLSTPPQSSGTVAKECPRVTLLAPLCSDVVFPGLPWPAPQGRQKSFPLRRGRTVDGLEHAVNSTGFRHEIDRI